MVDQVIPTLISQSSAFNVTGGLTVNNVNVAVGNTVPVGMWSPAINTLALNTNTAQVLVINAAGQVGINTVSPTRPLNIYGAGAAFTSATNPSIRLDNGATGRFGMLEVDNSQNLYIWNSDTGSGNTIFLRSTGSGTESMRITSSGYVGIGISNPSYNLVVSNAGAEGVEIAPGYLAGRNLFQSYNRSGSSYVQLDSVASVFAWQIAGTEKMRITSTGNVGIGTTTVAAGNQLSVYGGNIQVGTTGTGIKFADGSYQTVAYSGTVNGTAKAFVNFGYVAAAIVINGSYNVSSVTRTGTGTYTVAFTSALSSATYTTVFSQVGTNGSGPYNSGFFFGYQTGALTDQTSTTLLCGQAFAAYNSGGTTRSDVGAMASVAVFN
jgi:hypothetical protein